MKMIFKNQNKKGELTTKQLVTIIILIVSFVIILFLIFRLNLGETTNQEICRNSVVLRGQSALTTGPLDCKTNYLTISTENKQEIMKAIADEMASCWWQFGEGKIDYGGGFTSTSVHYAICSIISFDEKIQEKVPSISNAEFYDYLRKNNKTQSQTYLQYIYSTNVIGEFGDEKYFGFSLSDSIDTSQKYSVLTGIDNNLGVLFVGNDDKILNVFIIPTAETSSRLAENREFITKA